MPYLDTRDLEKRREELQEELDSLDENLAEKEVAYQEATEKYKEPAFMDDERAVFEMDFLLEYLEEAQKELKEWQEENQSELDELTALSEEIYSWQDGETLIPEDEFTEYFQGLLEDIGDLPRDIPHYIVIDWEATADNLKADYSEVEYQGTTYLVRSV